MSAYIFVSIKELEASQVFDADASLFDLHAVDLDSLLPPDPKESMLIIYQDPVALMANKLRANHEVEGLIALTVSKIQFLIGYFKKNRKLCSLVSLEGAAKDQDSFATLCTNLAFDVCINTIDVKIESNQSIYDLAANHLVTQSKLLQKTITELNACSVISYTSAKVKVEEVLGNYCAQLEKKDDHLKKVVTKHEEENGLLIQQLHTLQESFETNLVSLKKSQNSEAIQAKQLTKIERELQSHQDNASKELAAKDSLLTELQASLSEKVTENKDLLNQLVQQAEENDLLIQQLHTVQELLESKLVQLNTEQRQSQLLKQEIKSLENQLDNNLTIQAWLRGQLKNAQNGWYKNSRAHRRKVKKEIDLIKATELFNERWYLETYPDIASSGHSPLMHYLIYGASEGRNPSASFNSFNYIQAYPDVASEGRNPLVHFIKYGQYEGRKADPLQKRLPAPTYSNKGQV